MALILSCYYLDDPLGDDELQFLRQTLIGPQARFWTGAAALAQKRVPFVLPLPGKGGFHRRSREQRAQAVRRHLRQAGIAGDRGHQVVWVMPRDAEWDAVFQFAIRLETTFAPFVVQRWFEREGELKRGQAKVIDTHMLIQGL
ncbi:hypothetical protein SAMN06265795_101182 [Noviherbaspirillum humi]|uniref:Uncharacterized protein n=1 Tax=Noviherbaspirillum humi TaxID=1688639 RepID=A0A239BZW4_9BURK|nr:hypothetical protein [Noviherbaspirillum humi]SNS13446.1 hypothetical protein SAMN06265795_101182 [Noviherbaspirillum humi]